MEITSKLKSTTFIPLLLQDTFLWKRKHAVRISFFSGGDTNITLRLVSFARQTKLFYDHQLNFKRQILAINLDYFLTQLVLEICFAYKFTLTFHSKRTGRWLRKAMVVWEWIRPYLCKSQQNFWMIDLKFEWLGNIRRRYLLLCQKRFCGWRHGTKPGTWKYTTFANLSFSKYASHRIYAYYVLHMSK